MRNEAVGIIMPHAKDKIATFSISCLADRSSFDFFEFLQGSEIGRVRLPWIDLRPRGPGDLTNIDVPARVDRETVWRQELAEFGSGWCIAKAADELALMIDNAYARTEIGNVTADGSGRADFADVADRLVTVWHVEAARAVQVLPLRFVLAVAVEHLDPMVLAIGDVDPAVGVAADVMDDIELALAGSRLAPRHQQFAVG